MPHPENRLPVRITPDLAGLRVADVLEQGIRLRIGCDSCSHEALWTRGFMQRRLRRLTRLTLTQLGLRLACGCGSNYVRIWRG
jgi:hypothetical protein